MYVKKTIQSDPSYILQFAALGFLPNIYIYICEVSNFVKAPNFDSPKCQIYTHTSSFGTKLICSFKDKVSNYIITENNA